MSLEVNIEKRLGDFQLKAEFTCEETFTALLGASGCGKSLTLRCISGIEKPDRGRIVLNGRVLFDSEKKINLPPQERKTGYLFQNYALFQNMTVEQNIACGIHKEKDKKRKKAAVADMIKKMQLAGLEKRRPQGRKKKKHQHSVGAYLFWRASCRIRTNDPEITNHVLWPTELKRHLF